MHEHVHATSRISPPCCENGTCAARVFRIVSLQPSTRAVGRLPVPATALLLTAGDLPEGWRDSTTSDSGYRTTVCGVDLEPDPPVDTAKIRFARSGLGPFFEQHVRVYDSDTGSRVIHAVQAALPGCTRFEAANPDGSESATFAVEPLVVDGLDAESVAWRQFPVTGTDVIADFLMTRRGNTVVVLLSYSLGEDPDPAAMAAALAAVPE